MWVAGKMCDPLVTHGPYLSALEFRLGIIKRCTNGVFTLLYFTDYVTQECFLKVQHIGVQIPESLHVDTVGSFVSFLRKFGVVRSPRL